MYGDLKFVGETGYNADKDLPLTGNVNEESLKAIVEKIFTKAQNEKEYCSFYGDLCERIIRLELNLRNIPLKIKNLKESEFRKTLLDYCKGSFHKFFEQQSKSLDEEGKILVKHKLFCSKLNYHSPILYRYQVHWRTQQKKLALGRHHLLSLRLVARCHQRPRLAQVHQCKSFPLSLY
jgi:hypothetical protein